MATGVSLMNKDILRYFQTQNLLAPPEAIELTKLYNEMAELLKKPVKYQDQAIQMNLFYDLLSQYGQQLNKLKMTSAETLPNIEKPPTVGKVSEKATQADLTTPQKETRKRKSEDDTSSADSSKTIISNKTPPAGLTKQISSKSNDDDDDVFNLHPTPIPDSPKSVIEDFAKTIDPDSNTSNLVLNALKENDSTFQIFPDVNELIIHGRQIEARYFKNILQKLRNPEFRLQPKPSISDPHHHIVVNKLINAVQTTSTSHRKKILKALPGLQNAIATLTKGSRKVLKSDPLPSAYISPTSSTTAAPPQKLPIGKGKSKKSKYAVVNWNRWQRHLQTL